MADPAPFRFSRESQIRIDAEGHVFHEGERVMHEGLARALASWVDLDDATGRYVLRNSLDWCFVTVDDCPLAVRRVRFEGPTVTLELSDGRDEPLDPTSLSLSADDVLYTRVRGGRLPARFVRSAAFELLSRAELDSSGRATLDVGGVAHAIAR